MKKYKLKELKDCYVTVFKFGRRPQLYLIVPINEEEGVAIWVKEK